MPSSKDILEAQRFNRNRLITAFTSGTPDGREVDTPSPVRPLIFGLVVAVILSVVGIGMRIFAPNPRLGESQYELIDVKGTGARYFWANGVLHPIANVTTARLLSPESKLPTRQASAASLENIPRGAQIGLPDVPDDVPDAKLLSKQWLSCDMESGYHTWIARALPADNFPVKQATSALVQATGSGDKYFVDREKGKKYYIDSSVSRLGDWALSFQNLTSYPITVEPEWLDLFPSGTPLRPWSYNDIENAGQPAKNLPGDLKNEGITIGMVLDQVDSTGQVKNSYLVIDDSNLVVFNSTAARLYQDAPPSKKFPTEMFKYVEPVQAVFVGDDWPAVEDFESPEWFDESREASSRTVLCAAMDTTDRAKPTFDLVTMPEKRAIEASYDAESLQSPKGPSTTRNVTVAGGSGALLALTSGGGGEAASYVFISDMGFRHSLGDVPSVSMNALGWQASEAASVPRAWGELIPPGSEMSPKAAATSVGLK